MYARRRYVVASAAAASNRWRKSYNSKPYRYTKVFIDLNRSLLLVFMLEKKQMRFYATFVNTWLFILSVDYNTNF